MALITLTTDFGLEDWFVGTMKGVIASIAPDAQVVDITHGIEPGDIMGGAFVLGASTRFFPEGTIHMAVVDPGVGSARGAVVARVRGHTFVAPDNGLLSLVVPEDGGAEVRIHRVQNDQFFLHPVSRTFHGRDVFAPVAAHLSCGVALGEVGPPVDAIVRYPFPCPRETEAGLEGEVVYVDRFGNAITSIAESRRSCTQVMLDNGATIAVAACYADAGLGRPVAVFGSSGFLEIAINGGNAARVLDLHRGVRVVAR
ncbi:MAG TPA: SAM-dependent chlorinase/fluorinase [Opitutaceae bacterium]